MSSTTPLTDAINALTTYANEVTGKSDTTLSDAVKSLVDGYGSGDGDSVWNKILDGTVTEIVDSDGIVKSIRSNAFYECKVLSLVNFPSVTHIERNSFFNCTGLTSISFPSATTIDSSAFQGCSNLTSADFPVATSIATGAFYNCSNLTSVNFPVATSIGSSSFINCSNLTSVNFPVATTIDSSAFQGCSILTSIDFPAATSIDTRSFYDCSNLTSVILRKSDSICTLPFINAFTNTPIKSGTGYIYVPRVLMDTYKADSKWSTFAAQFRALEDYTVDGTITGELDPEKI